MNPKTKEIKKKLLNLNTLEEKIEFLKNKYLGEECYILSAGPSVKDYSSEFLNEKLKDKLIISVKQTYNIIPEIVDIHIVNPYNYTKYTYKNKDTIVIMVNNQNKPLFTPSSNEDLLFYVEKQNSYEKENSLAGVQNFEDYLLDKKLLRPFGPGIMYELGIYLPILLGVKKVITWGWDLGSTNKNEIVRFYQKNASFSKWLMSVSPKIYNKVYIRILNYISLVRYKMGNENIVLNIPGISDGEALFIQKSTYPFFEWYKKHNIEFLCSSEKSMLDKKIPRIRI